MSDLITEKIKKLLQMKEGGTAEEAENALLLAKKLADRHNIDLDSVEAEEEREPITSYNDKTLSRLQIEVKYSAMLIDRFFNVNAFANRGYKENRIVFVGTKSDIEIACYIYNFLIKHFRNEWNTKHGRLRNRQSFMFGMYKGIYSKLKMSEVEIPQHEGIILSNRAAERKDYLQKYYGNLSSTKVKPDREAEAAMEAGYKAGRNTDIHKGIKSSSTQKALNG